MRLEALVDLRMGHRSAARSALQRALEDLSLEGVEREAEGPTAGEASRFGELAPRKSDLTDLGCRDT